MTTSINGFEPPRPMISDVGDSPALQKYLSNRYLVEKLFVYLIIVTSTSLKNPGAAGICPRDSNSVL